MPHKGTDEMSSAELGSTPRHARRWVAVARLHVIAWMCHYLGISHLFFRLNRGRKRIITYHNVLPDVQFSGVLHQGVSHSAGIFRQQLAYLRHQFPCDTNLDNRDSLTITFDDGYLNQYSVVHPILAEFGLRACFFCTLAICETGEPLLTDRLMCWLSYVPCGVYVLPRRTGEASLTLSVTSEADRLRYWMMLNRLLTAGEIGEETLMAMFEACVPFATIRARMAAEAYALRFACIPDLALGEMRAYGHQIGAHGYTHRVLALLDDAALEQEIAACAAQIGTRFNTSAFSYPFGGVRDVTPRVVACVQAHGFTRAVSNINSPLTGELRYSALFLPRFALPNTASRHLLSFILSGAKYFVQHRRLLPKWP